ncbi:MAG: hypothetical protein AAGF88_09825 [Pseudomonadota bacterium]
MGNASKQPSRFGWAGIIAAFVTGVFGLAGVILANPTGFCSITGVCAAAETIAWDITGPTYDVENTFFIEGVVDSQLDVRVNGQSVSGYNPSLGNDGAFSTGELISELSLGENIVTLIAINYSGNGFVRATLNFDGQTRDFNGNASSPGFLNIESYRVMRLEP